MYDATTYSSPIGSLTLASSGDALVGLWMEGQKYYGGTLLGAMTEREDAPTLLAAKGWLNRYFAGEKPSIAELRLAPMGSAFQQEIWALLCEIPYGEVTTYGSLAKKLAAKRSIKAMSSQAVGGAVGHNPISIIIPCHRVVGASGSLTGFSGGMQKKLRLLQHEHADLSTLFVPKAGTALSL